MAKHMRRTAFELTDPMPLIAHAVAGVKYRSNWPLAGIADDRIAPVLLPQVYGKFRRATLFAKDWARQRGQEHTPTGKLFFRYCLMVDLFLMFDQGQSGGKLLITNSAAIEVVARDLYGLIKAFEDVGPSGDQQRRKTKFKARDAYDVATLWDADATCESADLRVSKTVRTASAINRALGAGGAE